MKVNLSYNELIGLLGGSIRDATDSIINKTVDDYEKRFKIFNELWKKFVDHTTYLNDKHDTLCSYEVELSLNNIGRFLRNRVFQTTKTPTKYNIESFNRAWAKYQKQIIAQTEHLDNTH